jgi:small GTP-binding protein
VLRKLTEQHIRVAVVGNVDAGKSTLIGSLVSSKLDNGRGLARTHVMKHKHELQSGRTSTIATHLLGLKDNGTTFVSSHQSEVALKAKHLVTLMDLAGHEKYLKTTIAGLSRGMADYALVLVNSMQSPTHMTRHHLKLCVSMGIPVIVVMTKVNDLGFYLRFYLCP